MKDLEIIIEKGENGFSGWIETDDFLLSTMADTEMAIVDELKKQVADYIQHEGKEKAEWKNLSLDQIHFVNKYYLVDFFKAYEAIKINKIAELAGLNESQVRHYASGKRNASVITVQKIENALHKFAQNLLDVRLV